MIENNLSLPYSSIIQSNAAPLSSIGTLTMISGFIFYNGFRIYISAILPYDAKLATLKALVIIMTRNQKIYSAEPRARRRELLYKYTACSVYVVLAAAVNWTCTTLFSTGLPCTSLYSRS